MANNEVNAQPLEFKWLDYCTSYVCESKSLGNRVVMDGAACFGYIFNKVKGKTDYIFKINYDPSVLLSHISNYCPLQMSDIIQWLDYLCSIINAKYEIKYGKALMKRKLLDCYEIHFHVRKANSITHKFLLTSIRYLYEWPFNIILSETFILYNNYESFRDESLLNIVNLVYESQQSWKSRYGLGHGLSGAAKLISDKSLKKKLSKRDNNHNRVNDLFEITNTFEQLKMVKPNDLLMYWESMEDFKKDRLRIYLHNYNLLLEEQKEKTNKQK
jgi:hypothetical protein